MAASVRSTSTATISGSSGGISAPSGVQPGDVMVAFQSADSGSLSSMTLSGGWTLLSQRFESEWPGSRVRTRTATAADAGAVYSVGQGSTADGIVIIVCLRGATTSDIQVSHTGSLDSTSVAPSTASGVQIRYGVGVPFTGASVSWSAPSGYSTTQVQAYPWTSGVAATRTFSSSAPLGTATLTPSSSLHVEHSFTVVVHSLVTPVPEPPVFPPFAPGKGSALYQYIFRRLLDGEFLGTLDLVGVSFDRRILQPGSFSATVPIPSRRIGDLVAEIIPRTPEELTIGPGVIVCDIWRAGEPWGEYWITAANPSRSRRGTPAIQLRGSTLDKLFDGVEIQDDLVYSDTDQVEIARQLITDMQSQGGANFGITLQTGSSGVARDLTYLGEEGGTYGQRLVELAQVDDGFEWTINIGVSGGAISREWVWGYPRLGSGDPTEHTFVDAPGGGDILEWSEEIDALRGATRWRVRGGTPAADDDASTASSSLVSTVHQASAHLTAGWPRIDRTASRSNVIVQQQLEDYAAYLAAVASGALRVDAVTVALGAEPTLTPNSIGDHCRIYLSNEWHEPHWRERRVIGMSVTPVSRQTGKEEMQLVLESLEAE